jgi:acyl-CoA thioesterase
MTSPDQAASSLPERCAAAMRDNDAVARFLGVVIDAVTPGRARARMTVTSKMLNGHGMAHGGLVFTLADTAFAYACNTDGSPTVARQCEIAFMRPAQLGDALVAVAELRSRVGRSGIYDVRVSRADGELVAEMRGHSATLTRTETPR